MYFSSDPLDRYYEKLMMGVPNFKPRKNGTIIFEVKETAVITMSQVRNVEISYREIVFETMKLIKYGPFVMRLRQYMEEYEMNPMRYKNDKHQKIFEESIRRKNPNDFSMLSALYLLTADLRLWNLVKKNIYKCKIDFANIHLTNANINTYTLFCCAKDLCTGSKHLTVADLADRDLISPKQFDLICNAMAIRRFGLRAVDAKERIDTYDQVNCTV